VIEITTAFYRTLPPWARIGIDRAPSTQLAPNLR
jgi:hypothetical protein